MMLCSNCSTPIRPVVAVDIDGTLGQWHRHFFKFAEDYFNRGFRREYKGAESIAQHMGITIEEYRSCKLAFRQGGLKRSMPPYTNARAFIQALQELHMEIWITTTRPYLRLDNLDPDTREWLARNHIGYDHLLYDEDKYEALVDCVGPERIIAVVEDEPEMWDQACELGLHPIMMYRMHNEANRRPVGAVDFKIALHIVQHRLRDWRRRYADAEVEHDGHGSTPGPGDSGTFATDGISTHGVSAER